MSTLPNYIIFRFKNKTTEALTCFLIISAASYVSAVEGIGRKYPNKKLLEQMVKVSKISDSITPFILLTTMFYNPQNPPSWFCDIPDNILRGRKKWILENKREELELIYYREIS